MTHIYDHCKLPSTLFRRTGAMHVCSCGKIYRLSIEYVWWDSIRMWRYMGNISTGPYDVMTAQSDEVKP